jgi:hypothetical protein
MVWRPWVIFSILMITLLVNSVLLYQERVPTPNQIQEVTANIDVLRLVQYTKAQRRQNFRGMFGMTDELANETAKRMNKYSGQKSRFEKMMKDDPTVAAAVFCVRDFGPPPPYAALELLVREENARRNTISVGRLLKFEKQPWYANAPVDSVYKAAEMRENRRDDATLMGVSALLLSREPDIIENRSPFSQGSFGSWSFNKLQHDPKSAKITDMVRDYFSLMYFMAELANEQDNGICF